MSDAYKIELNNGQKKTVYLHEQEVITALYTYTEFYTAIGQKFCIIFDVMYAKTGKKLSWNLFMGLFIAKKWTAVKALKTLGVRAKVDNKNSKSLSGNALSKV